MCLRNASIIFFGFYANLKRNRDKSRKVFNHNQYEKSNNCKGNLTVNMLVSGLIAFLQQHGTKVPH